MNETRVAGAIAAFGQMDMNKREPLFPADRLSPE